LVSAEVTPRTHLADFLRETLLLTGTHIGCEHGICGACTVEIDGEIARACITYAVACDGAAVRTIEGFADDASMAALRRAFRQHHALQCGYCTPGMLIAARDLVRRKSGLGRDQIRREMSGNLCRCTGYMGIIDAIAEVMAARPAAPANSLPPTATAWLGPAPGPRAAGSAPASNEVTAKATARGAAAGAAGTAWSGANVTPARAITVTMARLEQRDGRTRLSQHFVLDHPPAAVWALLSDIEALARCLPGLRLDGPPEGNRVAGHLDIKLGPITARFAGEGRLRLSPAEQRLEVEGRGADRKGGSNVTGSLACWIAAAAPAQTATTVHLDLAYALTGPLAQIGRGGIVRDLARRLGQMFAHNMDRRLSDPGGAMPAPPVAGLAILRQIILARLAVLFDRLRGRPRA
jgi:carbon-monoxide dehydrogenase small subunit